MPDEAQAVVVNPVCPTCDGLRLVARRYDSGRPYTRGGRIRAAAVLPCPTCTAPKQLDERNPDA